MFYKDYITIKPSHSQINLECHTDLPSLLEIESMNFDTIKGIHTEAVVKKVGNNPVICLSGGIDSQACLNLWHKDFKNEVIIFKFKHDFNTHDIEHAFHFCKIKNIKPKIIELDIIPFFNKDLINFGIEYGMSSPQFCVHAFFLKHIKNLGYSGAVLGGNSAIISDNKIFLSNTKAQLLDIELWAQKNNWPVINNFLAYTDLLHFKIILASKNIDAIPRMENDLFKQKKYEIKVDLYRNLGLEIIPQPKKQTGFEKIKEFFNYPNINSLVFETKFRMPLYARHPNLNTNLIVDTELESYILQKLEKININ